MNVGTLCSRGPVLVEAPTPLTDVAQLMFQHHVGAVIVTKSPLDRPVAVGMVTDRDITRAQLERECDLSQLTADSVMTRDPLVLCEDVPVEEAIGRLRARGVRRAPVVSAHGELIGVISVDDLIAEVARELSAFAHLLEMQPMLERLQRG